MSSECEKSSCAGCSANCADRKTFEEAPHIKSHIKRVISIISGKGGVGKSLVTSSLAVSLNKKGYKVGILDADITGPSIPKSFGVTDKATGSPDGMYPQETESGIKIMSVNLLLDEDDMPVIWRGPVIAGIVKQFWTDVIWGELDYLLIDMPPGTGDVPITVFQTIPLDGAIIVTSPQDLVSMIVRKSYHMADKMNIKILGLIENMSYITCGKCGEIIYPFGEGKTEAAAKELGIELLEKLPIRSENAALCDSGHIEDMDISYLEDLTNKIIDKTKI